jgi:hypothetical protein
MADRIVKFKEFASVAAVLYLIEQSDGYALGWAMVDI